MRRSRDDAVGFVAVLLMAQPNLGTTLVLKLLSGVTGVLSRLGDTYQIPVGLGLVMYVVNPDYMSLLFSETQGKLMLGGAVVGG